ncbi:hypothetical protein JCM8202_000885 [Rhodotorula sphaerocarpa]
MSPSVTRSRFGRAIKPVEQFSSTSSASAAPAFKKHVSHSARRAKDAALSVAAHPPLFARRKKGRPLTPPPSPRLAEDGVKAPASRPPVPAHEAPQQAVEEEILRRTDAAFVDGLALCELLTLLEEFIAAYGLRQDVCALLVRMAEALNGKLASACEFTPPASPTHFAGAQLAVKSAVSHESTSLAPDCGGESPPSSDSLAPSPPALVFLRDYCDFAIKSDMIPPVVVSRSCAVPSDLVCQELGLEGRRVSTSTASSPSGGSSKMNITSLLCTDHSS